MQNVKRLISVAIIFTLFMLIILCVATKSARAWIDSQGNLVEKSKKGICTIECINNTNHVYTFVINWIDHPFLDQTLYQPWSIAMGEVGPSESWKLKDYDYLPGLYEIKCYPTAHAALNNPKLRASKGFIIKPHMSKVTATASIIKDKLEILLTYGYST